MLGISQGGGLTPNDKWMNYTQNDGAFANPSTTAFNLASLVSPAGEAGKGIPLAGVSVQRRRGASATQATPTHEEASDDGNHLNNDANSPSFATALKQSLQEVNRLQNTAHTNVQDYAVGKDIPLHQVMISVTEADHSLQLATQVRNKLITAYQDIKNMPI